MNRLLLLFLLFSGFTLSLKAQKTEKYYSYDWKPCAPANARFFSVVEKTDTGWHRQDFYVRERLLQMDGTYLDDSCKIANGWFFYFHPNGKISSAGRYVNGKKDGLWLSLFDNGFLEDSTVYSNGGIVGTRLGFFKDGNLHDSAVVNPDGTYTYIDWFENGQVSSTGRYAPNSDKRTGIWRFYHENGKVSAREKYVDGKLADKQYFDESGMPMDTANRDREAEFTGGAHAWKKYLSKHLYFPPQYRIVNSDSAYTVVQFVVNPDGTLGNVEVAVPFAPEFDRVALNAIKNCKVKWLPAISHNRLIPFRERQLVNFLQTQY